MKNKNGSKYRGKMRACSEQTRQGKARQGMHQCLAAMRYINQNPPRFYYYCFLFRFFFQLRLMPNLKKIRYGIPSATAAHPDPEADALEDYMVTTHYYTEEGGVCLFVHQARCVFLVLVNSSSCRFSSSSGYSSTGYLGHLFACVLQVQQLSCSYFLQLGSSLGSFRTECPRKGRYIPPVFFWWPNHPRGFVSRRLLSSHYYFVCTYSYRYYINTFNDKLRKVLS